MTSDRLSHEKDQNISKHLYHLARLGVPSSPLAASGVVYDRQVVDGLALAASADPEGGAVIVQIAVHGVQVVVEADLHLVHQEPGRWRVAALDIDGADEVGIKAFMWCCSSLFWALYNKLEN